MAEPGPRTVSPFAGFATLPPKGHLPENVLHFIRVLRGAGLPVGPAKVIDALAAVEAVGVGNRTDFREALAAVLCTRREHLDLYEQAFELFWRNPKLLEKMVVAMLPPVLGRTGEEPEPPAVPGRLAEALAPPPADVPKRDAEDEITLDAAFTFTPREVLQTRDFATMSGEELGRVKRMLARLRLPLPKGAPRFRFVAFRSARARAATAHPSDALPSARSRCCTSSAVRRRRPAQERAGRR